MVCKYLGLQDGRQNDEVDWQVFRHIIQNDEVRRRLDSVVEEAATREGVNIGHPNRRLRHLDVVLWMGSRR